MKVQTSSFGKEMVVRFALSDKTEYAVHVARFAVAKAKGET